MASTIGTIMVVAAALDTHIDINIVTNVNPRFNLEQVKVVVQLMVLYKNRRD